MKLVLNNGKAHFVPQRASHPYISADELIADGWQCASALIALDKMGVILEMEKTGVVSKGVCWRKLIHGDGQGYMLSRKQRHFRCSLTLKVRRESVHKRGKDPVTTRPGIRGSAAYLG